MVIRLVIVLVLVLVQVVAAVAVLAEVAVLVVERREYIVVIKVVMEEGKILEVE